MGIISIDHSSGNGVSWPLSVVSGGQIFESDV
jgi:hypothetical protein